MIGILYNFHDLGCLWREKWRIYNLGLLIVNDSEDDRCCILQRRYSYTCLPHLNAQMSAISQQSLSEKVEYLLVGLNKFVADFMKLANVIQTDRHAPDFHSSEHAPDRELRILRQISKVKNLVHEVIAAVFVACSTRMRPVSRQDKVVALPIELKNRDLPATQMPQQQILLQ